MSFLTELKRRKVFRVGAAYAVAAWGLAQIADLVLANTSAPGWVMQVILLLLALGFPVALILAWAFELTPEGVKRTESADGARAKGRLSTGDAVLVVLMLAVIAIAGYQLATMPGETVTATGSSVTETPGRETATATAQPPPQDGSTSIAVLAFENMSPDPDNAFFAEGISEEILNVLASVKDLRVASRTSAFSFTGKQTPIPEIAAQLGVVHVLEGSVRKAGNRVRITAQLIDARTDQHLWSDAYDRDLTDIFAVQEEIARAITDALSAELGLRDIQVDAAGTASVEAYNAFLQGRHFLHKRGRDNVRRAIELLDQAVSLDPGFADARAQLARALSVGWGDDDLPRAVTEAETALALAPDSAMALMALASAVEAYPERAQEGLAAIERSLALRPDLAEAHHLRASYAARYEDDLEACIEHERRAAELDPTAGIYPIWIGFCQLGLGRVETGIKSIESGHALSPTGASLLVLAFTTAAAGEGERAIQQLESDPARRDIEPYLEATVRALVDALAGRDEAAVDRMNAVGDLGQTATFPSTTAWPYLVAGQTETASRILQRHIDDPFLATFPFLERYLPKDVNLEATDYRAVIAERGLPFYTSSKEEQEQ